MLESDIKDRTSTVHLLGAEITRKAREASEIVIIDGCAAGCVEVCQDQVIIANAHDSDQMQISKRSYLRREKLERPQAGEVRLRPDDEGGSGATAICV